MKTVRFVGLDVHAQTIAVAVAEPDGQVRSIGIIPNHPAAVSALMRKLASPRSGPENTGNTWHAAN
jgi:hypothetical protein